MRNFKTDFEYVLELQWKALRALPRAIADTWALFWNGPQR